MTTPSIVVGLDDSAASRAALRWATDYANATGQNLLAVHVLEWPIGLKTSAVKAGTRLHVPREDVSEAYWRGVHRVFEESGPPPASALQFAQGETADVLVRLSTRADLLVVGTREPLGRALYPTGSISHYCVGHASCPVVTVPAAGAKVPEDEPEHGIRYGGSTVVAGVTAGTDFGLQPLSFRAPWRTELPDPG
jgi:nucleotide-binding universal stress UspA family protein